MRISPRSLAPFALLTAVCALAFAAVRSQSSPSANAPPLVTGVRLTPSGSQVDVGSFPVNLLLSPDGHFVVVTNSGSREYVTVLRVSDGQIASQLDFNRARADLPRKKQSLYYGLAWGKGENGKATLYAARGAEEKVSVLTLDGDGKLENTGRTLDDPSGQPPGKATHFLAGLAVSADGQHVYAARNTGDPKMGMRGGLAILDAAGKEAATGVDLPGYPFAVAAASSGTVYVTSEQRGVVSIVDADMKTTRDIPTGAQPVALCFDNAQARLFVANAGSDTVSVIATKTGKVTQTILLRPADARALPGATPTDLALSPDEKTLYVTLADMNAIAVVRLPEGKVAGYLPVGWYPTAVVAAPDGKTLFVANAKGVAARNPNGKPVPGLAGRGQYIQNIIEGTVSIVGVPGGADLKRLTAQVLANNPAKAAAAFKNPGIKHVFYIIKENRTYDQVLGDLAQGNGDPSLTLFGRDVTPNLHALAERFVLLDNFYCAAEVSGDGWNWSTGGMISEFTARNVPHGYGGRVRTYDYEGTNNGVAVDRLGIPDAARPPGGYLWDACAAKNVSFRNYGFFADDFELPRAVPEEGTSGLENAPTKQALAGKSDPDFRQFDTTYADSEAWVEHGLRPAPKQRRIYGSHADPSRVTAWKREFAEYVKTGKLPALCLLRLGRDHTAGTTAGASSPRAMVADNDYAVGQVVETISRSPYWKSSAIVIVEDDAQNGFDHVDAHRSIAFVVSPFVIKGTRDSRFYNTDSALATIERLLGLPPMSRYDAAAPPLAVFGSQPVNAAVYAAILPARAMIAEVNAKTAYRAADSARLLDPRREESEPDEQLNDILWHAVKGRAIPAPPRRSGLR